MVSGMELCSKKARDTQLQDIVHNPRARDILAEAHTPAAYHNHNRTHDRDPRSLRSVGAFRSRLLDVRSGPSRQGQR